MRNQIRCIWSSKLSFGKVLFVVNRYYPFVPSMTLVFGKSSVVSFHAYYYGGSDMAISSYREQGFWGELVSNRNVLLRR